MVTWRAADGFSVRPCIAGLDWLGFVCSSSKCLLVCESFPAGSECACGNVTEVDPGGVPFHFRPMGVGWGSFRMVTLPPGSPSAAQVPSSPVCNLDLPGLAPLLPHDAMRRRDAQPQILGDLPHGLPGGRWQDPLKRAFLSCDK